MAHKFGLVSFVGRPNAGKSTLLNRLVGTKLAIVSDKPQTTRTRIHGVRNYPDAQVVFVDTPGIHRPLHRMNVQMVDAAVEAMREVDVVGLVVDASEPTGKGDKFVADLVRDVEAPVILILNKVDLMKKTRLLPIMERTERTGSSPKSCRCRRRRERTWIASSGCSSIGCRRARRGIRPTT